MDRFISHIVAGLLLRQNVWVLIGVNIAQSRSTDNLYVVEAPTKGITVTPVAVSFESAFFVAFKGKTVKFSLENPSINDLVGPGGAVT